MKKLLVIALAIISLQAFAQEEKKKNHKEFRKEKLERLSSMNAEEIAQIQTKKMTLFLDLTSVQQEKINEINLKNAELRIAKAKDRLKRRNEKEKTTKKEHLKLTNDKLDNQIATKSKMKAILNVEQYAKWQKKLDRKKSRKKRKRD